MTGDRLQRPVVARAPFAASFSNGDASAAIGPATRLEYLDGLRGVAATAVVVFHCVAQFHYAWLGGPDAVLTGGSRFVAATPLNVYFAGNLAVGVFFVHSGIVLSLPHLRPCRPQVRMVGDMAVRRPMRLVVPIAGALLLSLLLTKLSAFDVNADVARFLRTATPQTARMMNANASWRAWIWHIAGPGVIFGGHARFLPVLWTMRIEFAGSYVVLGLVGLFSWRSWVRGTACGLALIWAVVQHQLYLGAFVVGLLIAQAVVSEERKVGPRRRACGNRSSGTPGLALWPGVAVTLLCIGIWLGTLPEFRSAVWRPLWSSGLDIKTRLIGVHLIGATLIVAAVLALPAARRVLSKRTYRELGRISFSLYLLHELVLFTGGNAVFIRLRSNGVGYSAGSVIAPCFVLAVSLVAAWVFTRYVDEPAICWAKRCSARLGLRGSLALAADVRTEAIGG